jgi:hypothetical protein
LAAARYPADPRIHRLVTELRRDSALRRALGCPRYAGTREQVTAQVLRPPRVGSIGLDCDILILAGDDLRIMVYTAIPDSTDAERLALAVVLGTQTLCE